MPPADNTAHLLAAAARRTAETRRRTAEALRHLDTAGTPITFAAVADEAGVSRSWPYRDPDIRGEIEQLRATTPAATSSPVPAAERATDASTRRRVETLLGDNRALREENRRLRDQIAVLLGEQRAATGTHRGRTIGPCS
jgi:hypothetical protein